MIGGGISKLVEVEEMKTTGIGGEIVKTVDIKQNSNMVELFFQRSKEEKIHWILMEM